jgi:hypothetical protein
VALLVASDLIDAVREDLHDTVEPYLTTDDQMLRFVNEALTAYADETKSIYDDSSDAAILPFQAGDTEIQLHPSIIDIVEAYNGDDRMMAAPVGSISRRDLPTGSVPVLLMLSPSADTARLHPVPVADGQIDLTVIRRPLSEIGADDEIPDVPAANRRILLDFIKYRAYSVQDSELFDAVKAGDFRSEFLRACQRVYEDQMRRRSSASGRVSFRW